MQAIRRDSASSAFVGAMRVSVAAVTVAGVLASANVFGYAAGRSDFVDAKNEPARLSVSYSNAAGRGYRLDSRVEEVCGASYLYMLPIEVFKDCVRLGAVLRRPGLMGSYNDRQAMACSRYGYSTGISIDEKRRIIGETFRRYPPGSMSQGEMKALEAGILGFYNPGKKNIEEGITRCSDYIPLRSWLLAGAAFGFLLFIYMTM